MVERSKKLYRYFNPNPLKKETGDCTVRAICAATDRKWDDVFYELCMKGMEICEMPSANNTWGAYLQDNGYKYYSIPDRCPFCYTIDQFCYDHPKGIFILGTGTHVVCVKDGVIWDTWDSGSKVPLYYFYK